MSINFCGKGQDDTCTLTFCTTLRGNVTPPPQLLFKKHPSPLSLHQGTLPYLSNIPISFQLPKNGIKTDPDCVGCCGPVRRWSNPESIIIIIIPSRASALRGLLQPGSHHGRLLVLRHQRQHRHKARGHMLLWFEVCSQNRSGVSLRGFQEQRSIRRRFECHQGNHSPCCLQSLCSFCHQLWMSVYYYYY